MLTVIGDKVVSIISNLIEKRNVKGYETYLKTLEDVPFDDYDWNAMAMEEMADGMQYLVKENQRLKHELGKVDGVRLNEYQEMSKRTMPNGGVVVDGKVQYSANNIVNYAMGLSGETGEMVDLLKKVLFHEHEFNREKFIKEGGDVLHYLSGLCTMYDVSLEEIATMNIVKLQKRYPNGFNTQDSINRKDD